MLVAQMPKSKLFVALTTAHNINYEFSLRMPVSGSVGHINYELI